MAGADTPYDRYIRRWVVTALVCRRCRLFPFSLPDTAERIQALLFSTTEPSGSAGCYAWKSRSTWRCSNGVSRNQGGETKLFLLSRDTPTLQLKDRVGKRVDLTADSPPLESVETAAIVSLALLQWVQWYSLPDAMGSPFFSPCQSSAAAGAPPPRAFAPVSPTLRSRKLQPQNDDKVIIKHEALLYWYKTGGATNHACERGSRTDRSRHTRVRQKMSRSV